MSTMIDRFVPVHFPVHIVNNREAPMNLQIDRVHTMNTMIDPFVH